jgi:hypothetical protein
VREPEPGLLKIGIERECLGQDEACIFEFVIVDQLNGAESERKQKGSAQPSPRHTIHIRTNLRHATLAAEFSETRVASATGRGRQTAGIAATTNCKAKLDQANIEGRSLTPTLSR